MSVSGPGRVIDNGLVLYLDASNNKSIVSGSNTWFDVSRNSGTGSLINGPTFNGDNGGGIVFDGVNDYVSATNSISSRPFSFDVWIFFSSLAGWHTVVGQDTAQATNLGRFYFQKTHNTLNVSPRVNNTFGISMVTDANVEIFCYDPAVVTTSVWYNYCISVSATALTLFKNGQQVNTVSNSANLASANGNISIGAGYYANSLVDFVNGRVSSLKIYNRALSASEILQNYNLEKKRFGL